MFGIFKKKPIEASRLEFLFVACISDKLRKNENISPEEMNEAILSWVKKGGYVLSQEQSFTIMLACQHIALLSEPRKALQNIHLEDDQTGVQLRALRGVLAKNEIFLLVD